MDEIKTKMIFFFKFSQYLKMTTSIKKNRYEWNRINEPYLVLTNHKTQEYFYLNRDHKRIGISSKDVSWDEWPNEGYDGEYSDWERLYFYDDGPTAPRTLKSQSNLQNEIIKFENKYKAYRNISF